MMKLRRSFLMLAVAAVATAVMSQQAGAQSYPTRPVTLVVPTGAGGPQDLVARLVVERMRESLGQPLIIDNVPGAAGTIGIGRVARAKADGYTLTLTVTFPTHLTNCAVYPLPY